MEEAIDLRRQLMGHLDALRSAGIDWAPRGAPLAVPQAARRAAAASATVAPTTAVSAPAQPTPQAAPEVAPSQSAENAAVRADKAAVGDGFEQRRQALAVLANEIKGCMTCTELASTRTQTVFADGKLGAELCFVGEAPGADEDRQGLPFVGAAGQLLNKIIAGSGFKREEVYICNILKCRPPGNRTPLPNEAANCRGFLERQLELVKPKYIVALGGCAAQNLLQTTVPLGKLRGKFHDYRGIPVLCTYHPAYLLPHRQPEKKREVWEDMKMLLRAMGREIPEVKANPT